MWLTDPTMGDEWQPIRSKILVVFERDTSVTAGVRQIYILAAPG
jgi:hypothetical protein